jgi:hypothetical protein
VLIAFDGICFADGPPTGVARAFWNGLAAFVPGSTADCVLLLPPGAGCEPIAGLRVVAAPRGALARQLHLPRLLRSLRAALLHGSVAAVPLRAGCPAIAQVHDLPWRHPAAGEATSWWRRQATLASLRAAAAVLAPSTQVRDDAEALLGAGAAGRVHLVPHGTPPGPPPDAAALAARRGPFLVLGDARPRKNHDRLRAAHALARAQHPSLPGLQFIGPAHGYVDEPTKRALLATCTAVVHVSRFEGFGLPVLEGLAHGAPVLASALPPHREIAGEQALFVDADDTAAIAAALVRIAGDEALRARLAAGGHERARAFAPERVAARWRAIHGGLGA